MPKIVSPHLALWPKFSLDKEGKYAVSRSPLMYLEGPVNEEEAVNEEEGGLDLLYYFLGILNSSVVYWQIAKLSHKYRHGYLMLEPKTLKEVRVPNPKDVSLIDSKRLHELVEARVRNGNREIELEIDRVVADIYGLNEKQQESIGIVDNVS